LLKNGWFFYDLTLKPNYPRKAQALTTKLKTEITSEPPKTTQ